MFKTVEYPCENEECQSLNVKDELKMSRELDEDENEEKEKEEYLDAQQPKQCCAMVHATFESLSMNSHTKEVNCLWSKHQSLN